MKVLLAHQVPVGSSCQGTGVCGKCRIQLVSGGSFVSPLTDEERFLIEKDNFSDQTRISCLVKVIGFDNDEIIVDTGYW